MLLGSSRNYSNFDVWPNLLLDILWGNDMNVFVWLDNWHPLGPLFKRFGESVVF